MCPAGVFIPVKIDTDYARVQICNFIRKQGFERPNRKAVCNIIPILLNSHFKEIILTIFLKRGSSVTVKFVNSLKTPLIAVAYKLRILNFVSQQGFTVQFQFVRNFDIIERDNIQIQLNHPVSDYAALPEQMIIRAEMRKKIHAANINFFGRIVIMLTTRSNCYNVMRVDKLCALKSVCVFISTRGMGIQYER